MTKGQIKDKLKYTISSKRFIHSLNVMNSAVELAKIYGEDSKKAEIAGLLHDCARGIKGEEVFRLCNKFNIEVDNITRIQPELLHGPIGSYLASEEYGITDEGIKKAIYCHTMGDENMGLLDKIIFVADIIEPGRSFPGVDELREAAVKDIDKAVLLSLDRTLMHVMAKAALIHPDTVRARNYIIQKNNQNL